MIVRLKGMLIDLAPTHLVLDCGGMGYEVNVSLNTYDQIQGQLNQECVLHIHQVIREDANLLYGFQTKSARDFFAQLISVNGVGPSTAILMLSSFQVDELKNAILSQNAKLLQSAKGIGAKTAQRIIIDLKDKINSDSGLNVKTSGGQNKNKTEALSALEVLGFSPRQTDKILDKILADSPSASLEELVKSALKML